MFGIIGKLIALPVRIVNVPLRVADAALNYAEGGSGRIEDSEKVLGAPLSTLADAIEEAADDE